MTTFTSLPVELKTLIIIALDDDVKQPTCVTLCRTCKSWKDLALKGLYEHLVLDGLRQKPYAPLTLCLCLLEDDKHASLIKTMTIKRIYRDDASTGLTNEYISLRNELSRRALKLLKRCMDPMEFSLGFVLGRAPNMEILNLELPEKLSLDNIRFSAASTSPANGQHFQMLKEIALLQRFEIDPELPPPSILVPPKELQSLHDLASVRSLSLLNLSFESFGPAEITRLHQSQLAAGISHLALDFAGEDARLQSMAAFVECFMRLKSLRISAAQVMLFNEPFTTPRKDLGRVLRKSKPLLEHLTLLLPEKVGEESDDDIDAEDHNMQAAYSTEREDFIGPLSCLRRLKTVVIDLHDLRKRSNVSNVGEALPASIEEVYAHRTGDEEGPDYEGHVMDAYRLLKLKQSAYPPLTRVSVDDDWLGGQERDLEFRKICEDAAIEGSVAAADKWTFEQLDDGRSPLPFFADATDELEDERYPSDDDGDDELGDDSDRETASRLAFNNVLVL